MHWGWLRWSRRRRRNRLRLAPVWQPVCRRRSPHSQRWPPLRSQAARWLCRKQVPREHWPARRRRRRGWQSAPRPRPAWSRSVHPLSQARRDRPRVSSQAYRRKPACRLIWRRRFSSCRTSTRSARPYHRGRRHRSAARRRRDRRSSAATEASSERRCAVERSCARSADVSVGALLSTRAAKLSFPGDGADLGGGGAWKDRLVGSDVTLNTGGLSIFHLSYRQQGPGHPGFQKIPFNFNGL